MRKEFDIDFVLTDTITATRVTVQEGNTFLVRLMKTGEPRGRVATLDISKGRFVEDLTAWFDQDKDISPEDLKSLCDEVRSYGQTRPETGPMQFGNDWPGVFIRGDNAGYYAMQLNSVLDKLSKDTGYNVFELATLKALAETLEASTIQDGKKTASACQIMQSWEHCFWGKAL
ncbi:MAG: hypothetical protein WC761_02030 [Candidatus Paceibacterota bacterium]|jgi:hypothetical protein